MMRAIRIVLAAALVACCTPWTPTPAQPSNPVSVRLELNQKFFYQDDPMWVRITIRNNGAEQVANPVQSGLFDGFKVQVQGAPTLAASGKSAKKEPARPKNLAPRAFYGVVLDLSEIYPELHQVGTYRIHWSADGLLSDQLTVNVIPRFDPGTNYLAEVVTDLGRIEISMFTDAAPIAAKSFVDMANAGFYDGLQIHEVRPDLLISGGNVAYGDTRERHPFTYPAEITKVPLMAGTVVMKPVGAAPPTNSSEFIILLRPQQAWTGQVTAVGQVTKGMDVVLALSRKPSSEQKTRPYFRPLEEITIRNIRITERAADSGVGAGE